ncbi:hypothetical protein Salat_1290100 [Sesamum alatum]|uniref:Uncharacterized protein n=1 Tax=Sesamum alatum TaxID=300844 RepID=A0AAE1YGX4_9LAMI|nr:hypothetical protein Salat_1290100 [Sesamum alatum]
METAADTDDHLPRPPLKGVKVQVVDYNASGAFIESNQNKVENLKGYLKGEDFARFVVLSFKKVLQLFSKATWPEEAKAELQEPHGAELENLHCFSCVAYICQVVCYNKRFIDRRVSDPFDNTHGNPGEAAASPFLLNTVSQVTNFFGVKAKEGLAIGIQSCIGGRRPNTVDALDYGI